MKKYLLVIFINVLIIDISFSQSSPVEKSFEMQMKNCIVGDKFVIDNIIYGCRITKGNKYIFTVHESFIIKLRFQDYHKKLYLKGKELKNDDKFNYLMSNQLYFLDTLSKEQYEDFINKLKSELVQSNSEDLKVSGDRSELIISSNNKEIFRKEFDYWFELNDN